MLATDYKPRLHSINDRVCEAIRRLGHALDVPVERTALDLGHNDNSESASEDLQLYVSDAIHLAAKKLDIYLKELPLGTDDVISGLYEGFPVVAVNEQGEIWVFENRLGSRIEVSHISDKVVTKEFSRSRLAKFFRKWPDIQTFLVRKELQCDSISVTHGHHGEVGHEYMSPLRRFFEFLKLDRRDIVTITIFALVAGILALATPLAIDALVGVVSWGTFMQPLIVLSLMVLVCLGLAAVLKILQAFAVEIIQRRQFVRIVGDLSHRFSRAKRDALADQYPRETANRIFDIMTIQKATAILLLDGITIALTTVIGLVLLAFYHPFLLGFDIVLISVMVTFTWLLGRGGVVTAIDESICKYKVAHWLQDVIACPNAFKINGGEMLAVDRANRLTTEYLNARQDQFHVLIRQMTFAVGLQALASTILLSLGGYLVISQQLTLGQLVASELVVTVVVGAFAKAGKSLEKFYDLMAAIDKVGHLLDLPVDSRLEIAGVPDGPAEVYWDDLELQRLGTDTYDRVPATSVEPGSRFVVFGDNSSAIDALASALSGGLSPHHGAIEVCGNDAQQVALSGKGRIIGYAAWEELFFGTIQENIDLGRENLGHQRVREALAMVELWDDIFRLRDGLKTQLQTGGLLLDSSQQIQLLIARAIVARPQLLVIHRLLDQLDPKLRSKIWANLSHQDNPWTIILTSNVPELVSKCDSALELSHE